MLNGFILFIALLQKFLFVFFVDDDESSELSFWVGEGMVLSRDETDTRFALSPCSHGFD